jgi:hypothetical protein
VFEPGPVPGLDSRMPGSLTSNDMRCCTKPKVWSPDEKLRRNIKGRLVAGQHHDDEGKRRAASLSKFLSGRLPHFSQRQVVDRP